MSVGIKFLSCPYQDVLNLLPQEMREKVDRQVGDAEIANNQVLAAKSPRYKFYIIATALGIIAALGALFYTLGSHDISVFAMNALNKLGVGKYILGYGALGAAALVTVLAIVKWYKKRSNKLLPITLCSKEEITGLAERDAIRQYFTEKLKNSEMLAVEDKDRKMITILFKDEDTFSDEIEPKKFSYEEGKQQDAFDASLESGDRYTRYQQNSKQKQFISLEELQGRIPKKA